MRKTFVLAIVILMLGCLFTYHQIRILSHEKNSVSYSIDVIDGDKNLLNGLEVECDSILINTLRWSNHFQIENNEIAGSSSFSLVKGLNDPNVVHDPNPYTDNDYLTISLETFDLFWGTPEKEARIKAFIAEHFSDLATGSHAYKEFKIKELTDYLPLAIYYTSNGSHHSIYDEDINNYFKIRTPDDYVVGFDVKNDSIDGYMIESINYDSSMPVVTLSSHVGDGFVVYIGRQKENLYEQDFDLSEMTGGKGIYYLPINEQNEVEVKSIQNIYPLTNEDILSILTLNNDKKIVVLSKDVNGYTLKTIDIASKTCIDEKAISAEDEISYLFNDKNNYLAVYRKGFSGYEITDDGLIEETIPYISLEKYADKHQCYLDYNYTDGFSIINKDDKIAIVTSSHYNNNCLFAFICDKEGLKCFAKLDSSLPSAVYSDNHFEGIKHVKGSLKVIWH